jgi:hypothetical protein
MYVGLSTVGTVDVSKSIPKRVDIVLTEDTVKGMERSTSFTPKIFPPHSPSSESPIPRSTPSPH